MVQRGLIVVGLLAAGVALGRYAPPLSGEGVMSRRLEATVYVPLSDAGGRPFDEGTWGQALEELVTRFGGATLGPPQEGCWLDARRRVCREPVRPVVVSFDPARLGEFRAAVHEVGTRLGQESMYVRFEEPSVDLIPVRTAR
jgi:hypothetical protein